MDAKTLTAEYVSKYVNLLDKLRDDQHALAPLKVSILCSQHNENNQFNENESKNSGNHCQQCFTSWKYGQFVMKTLEVCKNKNNKLPKKRHTRRSSFKVIKKCLVCLNVTTSVFEKNKIPDEKYRKNGLESSLVENVDGTPKTLNVKNENVITISKKKPKKKKKNLFAGLNPLVFKGKDLCKKKKKNLL